MKKNKLIIIASVLAVAILGGIVSHPKSEKPNMNSTVTLNAIESLSACENPDGVTPNGHCVKNTYGNKFCKESSWFETNDCVQEESEM